MGSCFSANGEHESIMNKQSNTCPFCNIQNRDKLFENERLYIIRDIRPDAQHHYLVIPHAHISQRIVKRKDTEHLDLFQEMFTVGTEFMQRTDATLQPTVGFHVPPFNSINHLHMHVVAGSRKGLLAGHLAFTNNTPWFVSTQTLLQRLQNKSKL